MEEVKDVKRFKKSKEMNSIKKKKIDHQERDLAEEGEKICKKNFLSNFLIDKLCINISVLNQNSSYLYVPICDGLRF